MSSVLLVAGVLAGLVAAVLAVPAAVFALQVALGLVFRGRAAPAPAGARPRIAVLMPAHDEAAGIGEPLRAVRAGLRPGDRVLVVADNCSDDTARVARAAGADVTERQDPVRRGKGYALDHGVRTLAAAPPTEQPEVVVIVDADCVVEPGALDRLATACARTGTAVQALYLMRSPPEAGLKIRMAEFAWIVKNHVRPLGFGAIGAPCQLMGTGMAFPWAQIREAPLASGHIVEDMQLGLDLAAAGHPPRFLPGALVWSLFPTNAEGLQAQRTRWEHGHLRVIAAAAPRLLAQALARGRPALLAMVLDLSVPPLASLVLMLGGWLLVTGLLALLGGSAVPLVITALAFAAVAVAVLAAWAGFGRAAVSGWELATAPLYALRKIPLYLRMLGKRQVEWVRTRRDPGGPR